MTKRHGMPAELEPVANDLKSVSINNDSVRKRIKKIRESIKTADGKAMNAVDFYDLVCPYMAGSSGAQSQMSKWENKDPLPPVDVMYRIAYIGGCSLDELLFGGDRKPQKRATTWRDFCKTITAMHYAVPMEISFGEPVAPSLLGGFGNKDIPCHISMTLRVEPYGAFQKHMISPETFVKEYLEVLSEMVHVQNPQLKKYERRILHDALRDVPDSAISDKK